MNPIKRISLRLALFSLLASASAASHAEGGIALGATRVVYPTSAKQVSLSILNSDTRNRYLINSWIEDSNNRREKSFLITPPLFVSQPNSENKLRLSYLGAPLPADRESLFWVNVKAIPSTEKEVLDKGNVLQLAILSRIKLFVRPDGLPMQPGQAPEKLHFHRDGLKLKIENPSPYYITLVNLKAGDRTLGNVMVAPKAVTTTALPSGSGTTLSFQTINDYGATTPAQSSAIQ